MVVAIGQIGGIICPVTIGGLPHRLGLKTDTLSMGVLGLLILLIMPLVRYFLSATPRELLKAFHGHNEETEEAKQEPGFLEGIKERAAICSAGACAIPIKTAKTRVTRP